MKTLKLGGHRRVPEGTVFFHQSGVRSVVAFGAEDADEIVAYLNRRGINDADLLDPNYWRNKTCSRRTQVELYGRSASKGEKKLAGKIQYDWEALREWCAGTCDDGGRCVGQPSEYAGPKNLNSNGNYLFCYCIH